MKNRIRTSCGLSALGLLLAAPSVKADTQPDTLGEVQVVSPRAALSAEQTSTQYRISAEDIAERGYKTLDQALTLVPGLNVRTGGDGTPRIDIRGLRTREIRLLINGIPFNAAGDGQFDPTTITLAQVAEIRVITGGASLLYGEGGTAGVINVITKRGADKTSGSVDLRAGSGHDREAAASLGGASDTVDWFFAAEHRARDGFNLPSSFAGTATQGSGLRVNSDRRFESFNGNIGWTLNSSLRLGLNLSAGNGAFGHPPSVAAAGDPFGQVPHYDRTDSIAQNAVQISADWALDNRTRLRSWIYENYRRQEDKRYDNAAGALLVSTAQSGGYAESSTSKVSGLHAQLERALDDRASLNFALDTRRESYGNNGIIRDVASTTTTATTASGSGGGKGNGNGNGSGRNSSAAATTTSYGLRSYGLDAASWVDSAVAEYDLKTGAASGILAALGWVRQRRESTGDESAPIASLAGHLGLSDALTARASLSRKVRAPSLVQLYDTGNGNPDLKMERSTAAEAGLNWKWSATTSADVAVFSSRIRNFIQDDGITGRLTNTNRYLLQGMETSLATALTRQWRLGAGYAYLDARDESPASTTDVLQYRPRHKLSLNSNYRFNARSSLSVSVVHVRGEQYFSRSGSFQTASLPSSTVVDTQYNHALDGVPIELYIGARNLLDKLYSTSYGFPQEGRFVYAGMRARF
ncbi:TonB-dependent receptor [Noviherbaspirillum pedocola]|uniref:TonB-dependent receptor n=1 Tax=Noviherbaspirillum pedocola TaxID=2801341 RepID=A0A934W6U0_9BURK|nr:TonB-dependent receptor [Noviherbaspirillum pedocola]MBK4735550.1 TonB-dependent receptor [Noviherbaspirillum pedocola]